MYTMTSTEPFSNRFSATLRVITVHWFELSLDNNVVKSFPKLYVFPFKDPPVSSFTKAIFNLRSFTLLVIETS